MLADVRPEHFPRPAQLIRQQHGDAVRLFAAGAGGAPARTAARFPRPAPGRAGNRNASPAEEIGFVRGQQITATRSSPLSPPSVSTWKYSLKLPAPWCRPSPGGRTPWLFGAEDSRRQPVDQLLKPAELRVGYREHDGACSGFRRVGGPRLYFNPHPDRRTS